jgi:hypothetical protein
MRILSITFLVFGLMMTSSNAVLAQTKPTAAANHESYEAIGRNGRATRAPRRDCRRVQSGGSTLWECPTSRSAGSGTAGSIGGSSHGVDDRRDRGNGGGY